MTDDFKRIIDEDISLCDYELENGNKKSRNLLLDLLISKYGRIIDGFEQHLHGRMYDDSGINAYENIKILRQKMILFKAMEYKNIYVESESGITVNNSNQLTTIFNISFSEAKDKIENMSALSDADILEILEKISELENIVNTNERKTKKWDKAKTIITWIADKGVDVAMTLIPLLLKIGEQ